MTVLLFTPAVALFVPIYGISDSMSCDGVRSIGAFCLGDDVGLTREAVAVFLIVILLWVIVGYFPRYTAPVHLWATASVSSYISLPDGGEAAAQAVVLLLLVVSLGDRRINHWLLKAQYRPSFIQPVVWAAAIVVTLQVSWIYLQASMSKLAVTEWQQGSALYYVARDPMFGVSGLLTEPYLWLTGQPWGTLFLSWGAIIIEFAIAIMILTSARLRSTALVLAILLHSAFIVFIGLWSFALIMIGCVACATFPVKGESPELQNLNPRSGEANLESVNAKS